MPAWSLRGQSCRNPWERECLETSMPNHNAFGATCGQGEPPEDETCKSALHPAALFEGILAIVNDRRKSAPACQIAIFRAAHPVDRDSYIPLYCHARSSSHC